MNKSVRSISHTVYLKNKIWIINNKVFIALQYLINMTLYLDEQKHRHSHKGFPPPMKDSICLVGSRIDIDA